MLLCEVDNTNQRSSRRLVLCGAQGPTQESSAEVPTAHDSVETPQDGEPGSGVEDHPHHTQMEDVADTDGVASVAPLWRRPFPMTLPKKTTESQCGALGVISRVPMMWRRRLLSVTQEFVVGVQVVGCRAVV